MKAIQVAAGTPLLSAFGFVKTSKKPFNPEPLIIVPCVGLSSDAHDKLNYYLQLCPSSSRGGQSWSTALKQRYGVSYKDLHNNQKCVLNVALKQDHAWQINHEYTAVFSTACWQKISIPQTQYSDATWSVCNSCQALLQMPAFQKAICAKQAKNPENLCHMEKQYILDSLWQIYTSVHGLKTLIDSVRSSFKYKRAKS